MPATVSVNLSLTNVLPVIVGGLLAPSQIAPPPLQQFPVPVAVTALFENTLSVTVSEVPTSRMPAPPTSPAEPLTRPPVIVTRLIVTSPAVMMNTRFGVVA